MIWNLDRMEHAGNLQILEILDCWGCKT